LKLDTDFIIKRTLAMGAFNLTIEFLFDVCNLSSFALFADPLFRLPENTISFKINTALDNVPFAA